MLGLINWKVIQNGAIYFFDFSNVLVLSQETSQNKNDEEGFLAGVA